uniref:Odorant receptor n=1 Tax=Bracon brevicornis TaxID=1563983 RepID=A0A6V7JUP9_9HYME
MCIEQIEKDWKKLESQQEFNIMTQNVIIGRKITTLCAVFIYSGGMSYHTVMPFLMGSPASMGKEHEDRPIVFPGYEVLFNPYISPIYEVVYFSHCLAALIVYTITTVSCNMAASFVMHVSGLIQIMIIKLEDLVENGYQKDNKNVELKLRDIIQGHGNVMR